MEYYLLGISNKYSFHDCPTEGMFRFEKDPNIEQVPNALEFFGNTPTMLCQM
jgi:hypothetical protein